VRRSCSEALAARRRASEVDSAAAELDSMAEQGLRLRHDEGSSGGYGRGYASSEIHGGRTKKRGGGALVALPCCCPSKRATPAGSSQSGAAYLGARRLSEE
jgi:hypothetical protein